VALRRRWRLGHSKVMVGEVLVLERGYGCSIYLPTHPSIYLSIRSFVLIVIHLFHLQPIHRDEFQCANRTNARRWQMSWTTASVSLLDRYRLAHHLPVPAAFTSPYHLALLTNAGLGRQSPTMARRREKRRVAREQVALAVRKNFNGAAVSETDVVVEMVYKVRHRGEFIIAEGGEIGVDGLLTMGVEGREGISDAVGRTGAEEGVRGFGGSGLVATGAAEKEFAGPRGEGG